jgi:hypothetical protein
MGGEEATVLGGYVNLIGETKCSSTRVALFERSGLL